MAKPSVLKALMGAAVAGGGGAAAYNSPDNAVNFTRAVLGQGLGMGWGDELEAKYLSGDEPYEQALKRIRQEYAQYARENPGTTMAAEFAGGMAPAVGMMLLPGGQPAAAAQAQRATTGALGRIAASAWDKIPTLAKLAALGGATGAVSGAGTAEEGGRVGGAVTGGTLGMIIGGGAPVVLRGAKGAGQWLRERYLPNESTAKQRAEQMLYDAVVKRSKMTPQQIEAALAQDRAMGVPSVLANLSPATARLTRGVAKVGGEGAETVEDVLTRQKLGTRERVQQQVQKGLTPTDYDDALGDLQKDMRTKAAPLYESAYAQGEITDPAVLGFLGRPQFKQGLKEAQHLLEAEGRTFDMSRPTVEMLDHVKRGIDTLIERETDAVTGKMTSKGRVYTAEKNKFLEALDAAAPDYAKARAVYRGDAELVDAMRKGFNEFGSMRSQQVSKLVAEMSDAEKQAFRNGVARKLYKTITDPTNEINAAQRVFGSPDVQAKLQPLFDSPSQFELFKNAMEREAQLFKQSSRILGGSDTAENLAIRESLAGSSNITDFLDRTIAGGGLKSGLAGMALTALSKGQMTEETSARLAKMLMSKDPHEVAAVVKFLEDYAAGQAPKAVRATAGEAGAVMGATTSIWNPPAVEGEPTGTIESEITSTPEPSDDLEQEWLKTQKRPESSLPDRLE